MEKYVFFHRDTQIMYHVLFFCLFLIYARRIRIDNSVRKIVYLPLRAQVFSVKVKGKAVPLRAWSDPEGSRKLRFPDFMTRAQDGGKFVSFTHGPSLPPGNSPGTHLF